MSFLSELAIEIVKPQIIDYKQIAVVLPNKRAQKALDMEMARVAGRSIFPPAIFSIDEFVCNLSGLETLPMSELLLELYKVYTQIAEAHHVQCDDFQDFMSWGISLIGDFNDVDRQLADAEELFSYLKDFKDIGIEIESGGQPTAGQIRYLEFYGMLFEIYAAFGKALREKGKAYPGLVYRVAAENISELSAKQSFEEYFFAGLNAMTPSESRIIHYLYEQGKVRFLFDFDPFYLEYTSQIREELSKTFHIEEKDIRSIASHFTSSPKTIRTYGVSKTMNQIYEAVRILNRIEQDDPATLARTAVVFANESLVVPFVHAYDPDKCNISKKFPVRATAAYRLLQTLFAMARNWWRLQRQEVDVGETDSGAAAYYHEDVMALYRDPLVASAFCAGNVEHQLFVRSLVQSNQLFFSSRTLNERLPDSCPDVTGSGCRLASALSSYFRLIADRLHENDGNTQEILRAFAAAMDAAAETLSQFGEDINVEVRTVEFFVNEKIDLLDLSFKGDRTTGVQVMGLLETRTLDFDHVVMLSANEGILPAGNKSNSLLLYEIKKHFHLSTYEQNDAIYGYHFFHLLQRAKDIHLIYNADSSDEVAEESRFIKQIEFKKKKGKYDNIIFEPVVCQPLPLDAMNGAVQPIRVSNTEKTREKLEKFHFSASSLSTYINCPLQFYLHFVAGVLPEEDIDENVDQSVIGLVIHRALEELGNAIIASPSKPAADFVDEWAKKIEGDYILDLFNEYDKVKGQDLSRGRIYLATEVVRGTLSEYLGWLRKEIVSGTTQIIGCERRFSCNLDVDGHTVTLKGFADRIDLHNNSVAILDYKSGQFHSTSFKSVSDLFTDMKKKHIFQLFFYLLLYKYRDKKEFPADRFPDTFPAAGIIYLRDALTGKNPTHLAQFKLSKKEQDELAKEGKEIPTFEQLADEFEENIKSLINSILTTDEFCQTDNEDHCAFCDYKLVCQRESPTF